MGRGAPSVGVWSTATAKLCVAVRPPGSVAVTVMVAVPVSTAVVVSSFADMPAVATVGSDDSAVKVRSSPSGSVK